MESIIEDDIIEAQRMPAASSIVVEAVLCVERPKRRARRRSSPESEHNSCYRSRMANDCYYICCCSASSRENNNCRCSSSCDDGRNIIESSLPLPSSDDSRRRRHRYGSCQRVIMAAMMVLLAVIFSSIPIISTSSTSSSTSSLLFAVAFSPSLNLSPVRFSTPPSSSTSSSSCTTQLSAVRKRVGSHHHQPPPRTTIANNNNANNNNGGGGGGRRRKNNVFEQFTPEYIGSPYDVDLSPPVDKNGHIDLTKGNDDNTPTTTKKQVNRKRGGRRGQINSTKSTTTTTIKNANKINLRLRSLLLNDEGEINPSLPDDSPEAAQQLAQFHTYSKVSEEARRKAKESVSSHTEDEDDDEEEGEEEGNDNDGGEMVATTMSIHNLAGGNNVKRRRTTTTAMKHQQQQRRTSIRATVKETGSDSISSYTKSLGQHELLHKDDEVLLGRQVRMLMVLEDKRMELEEEMLRPPTFAQWAAATNHTVPSLKQQIRRSQRAKAALIEANLRLVITVARQAVKKSPFKSKAESQSIQFQDACQQGIIGLTRATEKFDPELGFRFSTYAIWWIQKEVARNVSEQTRVVRVPASAIKKINDIRIQERVLMTQLGRRPNDEEVAEKVGMSVEKLNFYRQSAKGVSSLDKTIDARKGKGSNSSGGAGGDGQTMDMFVKDTEQPSPSELIDQQMLKEDIRRLVKTLSPREQAVIRLRFGLDDGKPQSLGDISAKFGVEKEKVKKIEARALLKLRQPSRSQVVKCYVSDHT